MKCKAVLKEIEELDAGALLPAEVNTHLLVCESCRNFADERAALRLLVGSLEKVTAPPDFDWRLRARLAEARNEREPARRWPFGFAPGAQAIMVAASVTFLLVAVIIYRQTILSPANEMQPVAGASTNIKEVVRADAQAQPIINSPASRPVNKPDSLEESGLNETARRMKGVKAKSARTTVANSAAQQQQQRIFSTDFGARGAEELATAKLLNSSNDAGPVISVRMSSPQPAQLRFEDGQGTRRTLSSVNFGGQELVERPDKARLVPASEKGIW